MLKFILFFFILNVDFIHNTRSILFIHGGEGTGGIFGPDDSKLCDINDCSINNANTGWGQLADFLRQSGYNVSQISEGPGGIPVQFQNLNLSQYNVIVFGSNNAVYNSTQVNAVVNYVESGGSALFISDATFARTWYGAANSDQDFLSSFGLIMNQDAATGNVIVASPNFLVPSHPILQGVSAISGEGVSFLTVPNPNPNITILVSAIGYVRVNLGNAQGPLRLALGNDATVVISLVGSGKVVGHFDRNTFLNLNGVGTDLFQYDNLKYTKKLV